MLVERPHPQATHLIYQICLLTVRMATFRTVLVSLTLNATYKKFTKVVTVIKKFIIACLIILLLPSFVVFSVQQAPEIFVNGVKISSGGAFIEDGTTYVPLRLVSEALGAGVGWDADAYAVNIELDTLNSDSKLSELIRNISPSVVAIVGNYSETASSYQDRYAEGMAHGTGVIIKSGGDILTNAHVVDDLKNIVVVLNDGSAYIRYN